MTTPRPLAAAQAIAPLPSGRLPKASADWYARLIKSQAAQVAS
jgi:hypothetical protein